ncbi:hypothetical protein THASP1DRAFT_30570 [Thamnocephalis sphaerospora]|uniref:RGS domain-containing protein n=1 Tax=Thamnocephalis sphaerospora TaxID=78915 RepID=A0A4P9XNT9_9FUNG|nr:hypothetical protein THASP1DRAFT_30570 [Thamnocephalis sphaerospora]|eukprot:RKP07615.1 hypothetical protein THASP1DRAFT_30570 [Thamnocephalis sphaerospora]
MLHWDKDHQTPGNDDDLQLFASVLSSAIAGIAILTVLAGHALRVIWPLLLVARRHDGLNTSRASLQRVLSNPGHFDELKYFAGLDFSLENLLFYERAQKCLSLPASSPAFHRELRRLYRSFLSPNSPMELNLEASIAEHFRMLVSRPDTTPEDLRRVVDYIVACIHEDVFPRYVAWATGNHYGRRRFLSIVRHLLVHQSQQHSDSQHANPSLDQSTGANVAVEQGSLEDRICVCAVPRDLESGNLLLQTPLCRPLGSSQSTISPQDWAGRSEQHETGRSSLFTSNMVITCSSQQCIMTPLPETQLSRRGSKSKQLHPKDAHQHSKSQRPFFNADLERDQWSMLALTPEPDAGEDTPSVSGSMMELSELTEDASSSSS